MITFISRLQDNKYAQMVVAASALLFMANGSFAAIQTLVGHNTGELESPDFTFTNVPPPARGDAATAAKFTVMSGDADGNGGGVDALHDGKVPA